MARPKKARTICFKPDITEFIKIKNGRGIVELSLDEYETLRLIDYLGLTQQECALQMEVARSTIASIYENARYKISDSNGNYVQTGGFVLVKGGSSSGNVSGSIDVDGTVTITGGTCIALGGVCETPVNSANAYVLNSVSFSSGRYSLKNSSDNEVISFTVDGTFGNGWVCSDTLSTGSSYTLYRGSDSIADWTQESGTMGASGTGGFGGGNMGSQNGGNAPDMNGQNGGFGHGRR